MSKMPGRSLAVPDVLKVNGRGLSPQRSASPTSPNDAAMVSIPSSSQTSMSDEDLASEKSEEYTVLDGVREMNQILVRQIETLRLKIKVDEKNYDNEKTKLLETKDSQIRSKETEIEDLHESVSQRDEKIQQLLKAGQEKDKTIQGKCEEIEDLKKVVKQTKEYAQRIQTQVSRARHQKDKLEADPLYKQQNVEIRRLTDELELLRERLSTMEQELARAMKVIEQQNEKLKSMDADRVALHAKFKEDLDRASKAMRQEVERMREVMRQNYEEMRNLREQNMEMHNDVKAIKEMLKTSRTGGGLTARDPGENVTGLQRPLQPSYTQQTHGQSTAVAPIGPGKMVGNRSAAMSANKRLQQGLTGTQFHSQLHIPPMVRESSHFSSRNSRGGSRTNPVRTSSTTESLNLTSRLSPDASARPIAPGQTPRTNTRLAMAPQNLNVPSHADSNDKNLPPICSVKEGSVGLNRQPSGRGRKPQVRRGSAVRRK